MLINAMEVTGIEGTYRITCEKVMRVLRNNKDSLMAVLEAFIHDPIFSWKLVEGFNYFFIHIYANYFDEFDLKEKNSFKLNY